MLPCRSEDSDPEVYEELPEGGEDTLASYVEVCIDGEEEEGEGEEGHSSRFLIQVFLCDFRIRIHFLYGSGSGSSILG
jgi:hypothetical protein